MRFIAKSMTVLAGVTMVAAHAPAQVGLWIKNYSWGARSVERPVDIVNDAAGNVYSVGTTGDDVLVVSYTAAGAFRWATKYAGPGGGVDTPVEAVTDGSGNLFVVGTGSKTANLQAFMVLKLNGATGAVAWSQLYSAVDPMFGDVSGPGKGICVGPAGSVYACGAIESFNEFYDSLALKLDSATGAVQASATLGPGVWGTSYQYGEDIAYDGTNVFVGGSTQDNPVPPYSDDGSNMMLIKYNPNLVEQWHKEFDAHGKGDFGINVAVRPTLNAVYLFGNATTDPATYPELFLVRADSGTGAEVWRRLRATASDTRTGKMVMDAGRSTLTITGKIDMFGGITKRYRTTDGASLWETITDSDQFSDLAVDMSLNTYLVGTSTARLNTNGTIRWQHPQSGVAATTGPTNILFSNFNDLSSDLMTMRWFQTTYALTLTPSSTPGGYTVTGRVSSGGAAPFGGLPFTISESSLIVTPPASVTILAGTTFKDFNIATGAVAGTANVIVPITASCYGVTAVASLTLVPPTLASVSVTPSSVVGGNPTVGKVTLTGIAPAGGKLITLVDNSGFSVTPASATVSGGSASKTFAITTTHPLVTQSVTITATLGATIRTATLTINP